MTYLPLGAPVVRYLACAGVLCIQGTIAPGLAGLCLVYALDLTRNLKRGTAMLSMSESNFNSVERIVQVGQGGRKRRGGGGCSG